ncbi:MAG TPA: tetratricopeptide repeat protein [Polyangia bacterium]|nr:tetratricopeptide repeat protein [Polyangia bacterium]
MVLADEDRKRLRVSDQKLYLSETPLVDSRLVRGAHLRWPSEEAPFIPFDPVIEWHPEGRRVVKQATAARVGQKMAVSIEQRLTNLPTILEPVDSPEIQLSSSDRDSLEVYKQLLRELNPPVDAAAVQVLRDNCQQGRADSCFLLGQESLRGRDAPYEPGLAFDSFQAACRQGRGEGCFQSVAVLTGGHGLPSQPATVVSLLRQGCTLRHLPSCHAVATRLLDTPSDQRKPETIEEAKSLLTSACDGRLGESCFNLAELIFKQEGDSARGRAVSLAQRSCQYGYFRACHDLGDLALQGATPDRVAALRRFTAACALDPRRGTYRIPCHPTPEDEKRQELLHAAHCPILPPRCSSPTDPEPGDDR